MKRAGGGFDASYNAQTAVDEQAHIIVAAERTNCGSDAGELPVMLQAVVPATQVDCRATDGWIKNILGSRQFSLRGLHRVRAEWKLVCMALNLRRMAALGVR